MRTDLKLFPPGSEVVTGPDVKARVVAIRIGTELAVEYFLTWWEDGKRQSEWVAGFEVSNGATTLSVGFK
jgi:hypothetical protein